MCTYGKSRTFQKEGVRESKDLPRIFTIPCLVITHFFITFSSSFTAVFSYPVDFPGFLMIFTWLMATVLVVLTLFVWWQTFCLDELQHHFGWHKHHFLRYFKRCYLKCRDTCKHTHVRSCRLTYTLVYLESLQVQPPIPKKPISVKRPC